MRPNECLIVTSNSDPQKTDFNKGDHMPWSLFLFADVENYPEVA